MEPTNPWSGKRQERITIDLQSPGKQFKKTLVSTPGTYHSDRNKEASSRPGNPNEPYKQPEEKQVDRFDHNQVSSSNTSLDMSSIERQPTNKTARLQPTIGIQGPSSGQLIDRFHHIDENKSFIATFETQAIPMSPRLPPSIQGNHLSKSKVALLISLLCIILLQAFNAGQTQFTGAKGWAYVLTDQNIMSKQNLLKNIGRQLNQKKTHVTITSQQYINQIITKMTPDQKLGQMMLVQFIGPDYSADLSEMVSQYGVGSILIFAANHNISNKDQLTTLTKQIQQNAQIPLALAIDQEGGLVDRLVNLDGARPSAGSIGATNNPLKAIDAGNKDANDLASYGININLAPVVDVDTLNGSTIHVDDRAFGTDADTVTKMAGAYLQGLQRSGKVFGTLKHFPGLGHVYGDPHTAITSLRRSNNDLEQIDWAPYRNLIQQGHVHAIMVTHEFLPYIDASKPSSLSNKVVQGVLRDEFGFQGVIMTDSLTMDGVTKLYTPGQAAALAIEAGSDLLMGASTPATLDLMINGIKDAMNTGEISQQRIDESVRRILMMKYDLGLLPLPTN